MLDVLLLLSVSRGLCEPSVPERTVHWRIDRDPPLSALMTNDEADGTTETAACLFWMVSWTVTRRPFQSPVALAMSSPTFFGDYEVLGTDLTLL